MTCNRCHRRLKREPIRWQGLTLGPKCAVAVGAPRTVKPARTRKQHHSAVRLDDGQRELFEGATA